MSIYLFTSESRRDRDGNDKVRSNNNGEPEKGDQNEDNTTGQQRMDPQTPQGPDPREKEDAKKIQEHEQK